MKNFVLLCLVTLISSVTFGSHYLGSDVTWKHLSGSVYQVNVTLYIDCSASSGPSITAGINSASCNQNFTQGLSLQNPGGTEITNNCAGSAKTTCNGGTLPGIKKWIYSGTVTLPMACTDWRIDYTACCRGTSSNLTGTPGHSNHMEIDNKTGTVFTGVQFVADPVGVITNNDSILLDCSITKVPGDSIIYTLQATESTTSTLCTYQSGYTYTNFAQSTPAEKLDMHSGILKIGKVAAGNYYYRVQAKIYRNGKVRGAVNRDMIVLAGNIANVNPLLTGINGTSADTICINEGDSLYFNVLSSDGNASDSTFISLLNPLSGMSLIITQLKNAGAGVLWGSHAGDAAKSPFEIDLKVRDNACPFNGVSFRKYYICVKPVVTGVQSVSDKESLTVYPNPAREQINIVTNDGSGLGVMHLLDQTGRVVKAPSDFTKHGTKYTVDVSGISAGIYIMKYSGQHGIQTKKVIIE